MKQLLYLLPLFYALHGNAQAETNEHFVTVVSRGFVDSSFQYYYLNPIAVGLFSPTTNERPDEQISNLKVLLKNNYLTYRVPDFVIKEIINNGIADSIAGSWNIPLIPGAALYHPPKQKRSEQHKRTIFKKTTLIPDAENTVFTFSKPVYDDNKDYAVIRMSRYSHIGTNADALAGMDAENELQCFYCFKRVGDNWVNIGEKTCWSLIR